MLEQAFTVCSHFLTSPWKGGEFGAGSGHGDSSLWSTRCLSACWQTVLTLVGPSEESRELGCVQSYFLLQAAKPDATSSLQVHSVLGRVSPKQSLTRGFECK